LILGRSWSTASPFAAYAGDAAPTGVSARGKSSAAIIRSLIISADSQQGMKAEIGGWRIPAKGDGSKRSERQQHYGERQPPPISASGQH